MSSVKAVPRKTGVGYDAKSNLNKLVEEWALQNADKFKRSCASCSHACRNGPFSCTLYGVIPPLDVIMNGCDGHNDVDDIPF